MYDNTKKIKMQQKIDYLDKLPCLFIQSTEVINALYPQTLNCSNKRCKLVKAKITNIMDLDDSYISDNELEIANLRLSPIKGKFSRKLCS